VDRAVASSDDLDHMFGRSPSQRASDLVFGRKNRSFEFIGHEQSHQSCRSATIGSIRVARGAGTQHAGSDVDAWSL